MLWILLSFIFNPSPDPSPERRGDVEYTATSSDVSSTERSTSPLLSGEGSGVGLNDAPLITWLTEQDHDFGALPKGKPATFVFKFKNAAPDTILLQTVRTTCGCTAARYTEEPIAPSATGEITVEYDAYQSGAFSKKIRVFFDKQKKAEILWIRGKVD